jgi:hypothetical protein
VRNQQFSTNYLSQFHFERRLEENSSGQQCGHSDAARHAKLIAQAKVECECKSLREFARSLGIDAANLTKVLAGRRRLSLQMFARLGQAFPLKP